MMMMINSTSHFKLYAWIKVFILISYICWKKKKRKTFEKANSYKELQRLIVLLEWAKPLSFWHQRRLTTLSPAKRCHYLGSQSKLLQHQYRRHSVNLSSPDRQSTSSLTSSFYTPREKQAGPTRREIRTETEVPVKTCVGRYDQNADLCPNSWMRRGRKWPNAAKLGPIARWRTPH